MTRFTWVKAPLTEEQAKARGISRTAWDLNRLADQQATLGVGDNTEDPGAWTLYEYQALRVRELLMHLVKVYTKVRTLGLGGPNPGGLTDRHGPCVPTTVGRASTR